MKQITQSPIPHGYKTPALEDHLGATCQESDLKLGQRNRQLGSKGHDAQKESGRRKLDCPASLKAMTGMQIPSAADATESRFKPQGGNSRIRTCLDTAPTSMVRVSTEFIVVGTIPFDSMSYSIDNEHLPI
jgi:hypothetical protein